MKPKQTHLLKNELQNISESELEKIVDCFKTNTNPEIQEGFLKSVFSNGLSKSATAKLTKLMAESGDQLDLSEFDELSIDKHSTGGISDTTTIVLMPILACGGLFSVKMSGKSLGHTGGTVDKLESITDLSLDLDSDNAIEIAKKVGFVFSAQSSSLVPADKTMYALRDKLNLVSNISLIASSIMSKKIASGAKNLILDIKCGKGALLEDFQDCQKLALEMKEIGNALGRNVACILTNMNSPLGRNLGDLFELCEAYEILINKIENGDLRKLIILLAAHAFKMTGKTKSICSGKRLAAKKLKNGAAQQKFLHCVKLLGGDMQETYQKYQSQELVEIKLPKEQYIQNIDCQKLGNLIHKMRTIFGKDVGIKNMLKIGEKGSTLCSVSKIAKDYSDEIKACFTLSDKKIKKQKLILKIIN